MMYSKQQDIHQNVAHNLVTLLHDTFKKGVTGEYLPNGHFK